MISPFFAALGASTYALPNGTEPLVFLDFKNGIYTADGVTVAVTDLLAQDTDYGLWDPAFHITGAGAGGAIGHGSAAPVFTGDALALVLDGATILATLVGTSATTSGFRYELADSLADFNSYYYSKSSFDPGANHKDKIGDQVASDLEDEFLASGSHSIALTFIAGKISRSVDGAAFITINPAAAWSPAMAAMGFVIPTGLRVEQIGIYPAQADGDLSMLSANGYPVLSAAPIISGTAQVGQTLSVTTGTWSAALSFAYQWARPGDPIAGETGATYLVDAADEGFNLSCTVSATNATGTAHGTVTDDDAVVAA